MGALSGGSTAAHFGALGLSRGRSTPPDLFLVSPLMAQPRHHLRQTTALNLEIASRLLVATHRFDLRSPPPIGSRYPKVRCLVPVPYRL